MAFDCRYTIHPDARKEILKRLLLLNHQRYAEEVAADHYNKKEVRKEGCSQEIPKKKEITGQIDLFGSDLSEVKK